MRPGLILAQSSGTNVVARTGKLRLVLLQDQVQTREKRAGRERRVKSLGVGAFLTAVDTAAVPLNFVHNVLRLGYLRAHRTVQDMFEPPQFVSCGSAWFQEWT